MPVPPPTTAQSFVTSLLLLLTSLALAPLSFLLILPVALTSRLPSRRHTRNRSHSSRPTVLINNGRTTKSLFLARSLHSAGARVILIDESPFPLSPASSSASYLSSLLHLALEYLTADYSVLFSHTRFSRTVDKFVVVPSATLDSDGYLRAIVEVARREEADVWWPCSGVGTTGDDARVGEVLERVMNEGEDGARRSKQGKAPFKAVIQKEELAMRLHEKDLFISLLSTLSLPHPHTTLVTSPSSALSAIRHISTLPSTSPDSPTRAILKASSTVDDIGRADMTLYPLSSDLSPVITSLSKHDSNKTGVDLPATSARLEELPISKDVPYIVQEFVPSRNVGGELATHSTVVNGRLIAFISTPSNDMLLTYTSNTLTRLGLAAENYTTTFLDRLAEHLQVPRDSPQLTGQFSLDFMLRDPPREGIKSKGWRKGPKGIDPDLVCVECNPRVHTAVVLLGREQGRQWVEQTLSEIGWTFDRPLANLIVRPAATTPSRSWLPHDLLVRLLPRILHLPTRITMSIHPLWGRQPPTDPREDVTQLETTWNDPTWEWDDPWPAWGLYHVQWPAVMLASVLGMGVSVLGLVEAKGKGVKGRWSRLNVSTGRVFAC